MTIRPKTEHELDIMRTAGKKLNEVLKRTNDIICPGKTLHEIDSFIAARINDQDAKPSFKGYNGYPSASCLSLNSVVVHGIPTNYALKEGDLLGVDVGLRWEGYHSDAAFTKPIGQISDEALQLLVTTQKALRSGIDAAVAGNTVGDIGNAIQKHIQSQGHYGIIYELTGHGIGSNLQESPEIPNYANKDTTPLVNGMTLAIEPMVSLGSGKVQILDDKWSVETIDKSLSAHFESTIIICDAEAEILVDFPLFFPVDQRNKIW
jgi:methionyl aminopeptidase